MKLEELRASVQELRDEVKRLSEIEDITPEDDARLTEACDELPVREAELEKAEARAKVIERAAIAPEQPETRASFSAPQVARKVTAQDVLEDRSATRTQISDAILRSLDERDVDDTAMRRHLKRHGSDTR